MSEIKSCAEILKGDALTFLKTGYPELDAVLDGGWCCGSLNLIASRPGHGKTAFALDCAMKAALSGVPVLYFSLESSAQHLTKRAIAKILGFHAKEATLEQEERLKALCHSPFYIDDTGGLKTDEFERKVRDFVADRGNCLVFVDYIQLMSGPQELRGARTDEVDYIVRKLKTVARELDVPVVALSQLFRYFPFRNGASEPKPELRDLRESRTQETASDVILMLDKKNIWLEKSHNGRTATLDAVFEEEWAAFTSLKLSQD